ncbi:MAG: M60 family metallopeptidase [Phycisphaeraceae bacterium]|nr:M60 family metallopeptidase [Phycisphaeraceae bacterium]
MMHWCPRVFPLVVSTLALVFSAAAGLAAPPTGLTQEVRTIAAPGTPGTLAVWSPDSTVLAVGKADGVIAPVAAAGRVAGDHGASGRIVAFSHTGHLDPASLGVGEHEALLRLCASWAAREREQGPRRIALINCKLGDLFRTLGFEIVDLGREWGASGSAPMADRIDLLCIVGNALSDAQVDAVSEFLSAGGGLLAAQTAWAWKTPPGRSLVDNPLNRIAGAAGIAWTDRYAGKNDAGTFDVAGPAAELTHAHKAIDAMTGDDAATLGKPAAKVAAYNATAAARLLPPTDDLLRPRLDELLARHKAELTPTPERPADYSRPLQRVLIGYRDALLQQASPETVREFVDAGAFPNLGASSQVRRRGVVQINTATPGWHSTGLYALPGTILRIELPENAQGLNLRARVGCHADELWHHDSWKRVPSVTIERIANERATPIASAFGGPVYIVVPEGCEPRNISVHVHGVIEAPMYTLGQTAGDEWITRIRNRPAPWAELATDKVILSVPSSAVRSLDDPKALLTLWDRILDAAADLAAMPRQRVRPERYVADVQISAGYMHAGYPIMTHLDAADDMTDASRLAAGSWGLFHELGHNHQSPDWTFDGTVEVTCNLFSLYICETVCAMPPSTGHPALEKREETIGRYFARGAKFDEWKREPFTALIMYMQLRESFGWEAYKKVFAEYRELPDAQRPKSDDDKRDQWMVRFSRAVGRNLGPFFAAWGVPTSQAARDSIADLPEWMPEGFPPRP